MKRTHFFLTLLAALATARADLVIEQKLDGAGQNGTMTVLKLKGGKLRVDMQTPAGAVSSIMDMDTGESLTLMHAQKTALKMSAAQTKETLDAIRKKAGTAAEAEPAKPEATGRKEKVGDYNAEVFTWKGATGVQTLWVTKDLPNYANVKGQFDRLNKWSAVTAPKGTAPDMMALPGVVVKMEVDSSGQKFTSTVVSVKEEDLDVAIFDAPKDYREATRPDAPPSPPAPAPAK